MLLTRSPLSYSLPRPLRVRLACVRHAASVDSEPGSNSHVRWFASRASPALASEPGTRSDSTNTRPVNGSCVVLDATPSMFREAPTPGLLSSLDDWPRPTTPRGIAATREAIEPDRHPLILDGLAVTFYLVFKEPALPVHPPLASQPSTGEPFKHTDPPHLVSSLNFGLLPRAFRAPVSPSRHRPEASPLAWSLEPRSRNGRRVASHAQLLRHEPGGFSNLKVGMRAVCFRRGRPFGHPCAPVTLRRA